MEQNIPKRVTWIGAFVLAAVAYLTYHPGLAMGFYLDDYLYLERAGRTAWSNALAQFFDPNLQIVWYRPLQAIQFFFEFHILGANANGYHLLNITFHVINLLLLYLIVWRLSKQWLIGWMSAFFYTTFSVFPSAINWVGIVDPLASAFYLLSIWFWLSYLERANWQSYALTFASFVLALLCKQIGVTIPIILFLIEWWLLNKTLSVRQIVQRYVLFVVGAIVFMLLQDATPSTHTMIGVFGWQISAKMAFIFAQYLVLFFFPYGIQPSIDVGQLEVGTLPTYAWMVIAVVLLARVIWKTRNRALVFLCILAAINLLPVLPFPFIEHRYLYLPMMAAGIMLALLFNQAFERYGARRISVWAAALVFSLLALDNGFSINASALAAGRLARDLRAPFGEIERQYPALPKNTLLYFIDPTTPTKGGLGGMAMLRYGPAIWVEDWIERAEFDKYDAVHVYYFDDASAPREIIGEKNVSTHLSHSLPVDFQCGIHLDGYEVPRVTIQRGTPIILVLYWRATRTIDRDYGLFMHLIAPNGEVVAAQESSPRKGQLPTHTWEINRLTPDAILLPMDVQVPPGSGYRMEIGWYDVATHQRLSLVNDRGQPVANTLILESFTIEP